MRQAWLSRQELAEGAKIFVPMCGKRQNMAWLFAQNLRVTGIDISPITVAAFFKTKARLAVPHQKGRLDCWQSGSISLFCGDVFKLLRGKISPTSPSCMTAQHFSRPGRP